MIEPESKPAPAGLEALGKVIALRTGKARVTGAGEGATGIDTLSEKVAGLRAGGDSTSMRRWRLWRRPPLRIVKLRRP